MFSEPEELLFDRVLPAGVKKWKIDLPWLFLLDFFQCANNISWNGFLVFLSDDPSGLALLHMKCY